MTAIHYTVIVFYSERLKSVWSEICVSFVDQLLPEQNRGQKGQTRYWN